MFIGSPYRASFVAEAAWKALQLPCAEFAPHRTDVPLDRHNLRRQRIAAIGSDFLLDLFVAGVSYY